MTRMRSYKYRIFPTNNQRIKLTKMLDECRWYYNYFLEERKNLWGKEKESIGCYAQMKELPVLEKTRGSLKFTYAQSLCDVATRLDLAFNSFFRRVRNKETPGFPRFKSLDRYNSFTYPQAIQGVKLTSDHKIKLSKIGSIKIKLHRKPPEIIKQCIVKRSPSGKWFVCLVGEVETKQLPAKDTQVALDVGIQSFATLDDGSKIENPKFLKYSQNKLAKAQKKLNKLLKGSEKRSKQKLIDRKSVV